MLITNVPGMGGAGIQSPDLFWTSRPVCGVAWRRYVRKQESLCGPTPCVAALSSSDTDADDGSGYLISFNLCCCGVSKN